MHVLKKMYAKSIDNKYKNLFLMNCIFIALHSATCFAEDVEFNTDILDVKDRQNIDLSHFAKAGYIMPGNYSMLIKINKDQIPAQDIRWVEVENDSENTEPCLDPDIVNKIGFKPDFEAKLKWTHGGQCLDQQSVAGLVARGDLGTSMLSLNIPQAYLEYRAPNWDPPSLWDNGVGGLIFDYYSSADTRHDRNGDYNSLSGNGTTGGNVGSWRFRADWQANYSNRNTDKPGWDWSRYYAYRALPQLGAKMTVGEDSLYSDIFDSFRFTGVSLKSDDKMLPPNLRDYAPEVTGVARTNAKVVISQQGRVIKETQVPTGPFRIQDLNTAINGLLDVRVEEQDGSVQTFQVNSSSVPYLTRPGQVRYKLAVGKPSNYKHEIIGSSFATGEFSWGVNNGWSLYGGGVADNDYQAGALGIGRDLSILGAVSLDATQSRASIENEKSTVIGNSYRLSYSKRFDDTNSQVTFAGYRFSTSNFMSMNEYLNAKNEGDRISKSKEMYTVSFSQYIENLGLSAYLNYSHQTYWDRSPNDRYTITFSRLFDMGMYRNINFSMTAYQNKRNGSNDNGMYLSLSVPWGNDGSSLGYSGSLSKKDYTNEATYYSRLNEGNTYQFSVGQSKGNNSVEMYTDHDMDYMHVNANASYQAGKQQYSALSISARGGATATMKGLALHRTNIMGGSRVLIDTDGASHIPVKGAGFDTHSNSFGDAVVTDVSDYYRNELSVDLDSLPDDAEVSKSVVQTTLTEGAIGFKKFDVVSGAKFMASVHMQNGSSPPFGSMIVNDHGQNVGLVGDDGSVYLSGIKPRSKMSVQWDGKEQCVIKIADKLPRDLSQTLLLPCN